METLWQEFKDRNVVLLGVNIDEPESVVEDFVKEFSLTYPVLLGNTSLKNVCKRLYPMARAASNVDEDCSRKAARARK